MRITEISAYKGSTISVIFDTDERIYINEKILAEYHLKEGMNVPAEAVEEMVSANGYRRARERALYLLDVRDYGFVELYQKLEKNYSRSEERRVGKECM